jgi:ferredoxin-NADP reductase
MRVRILSIITHKSDIWSFRLERPQDFEFKPGQFLMLSDTINSESMKRAYSISSSPLEKKYLEITVRLKPGGKFTTVLFTKIIGEFLELTGPFGQFHFDLEDTRTPIFIAGGTGIAPLLSMLRTYLIISPTSSELYYLFYGIRREEDEVFKEELAELTLAHERFIEIIAVGEPCAHWQGDTGHMRYELIKEAVVNPLDCTYYLCGPEAMVASILQDLQAHGIPQNQIKLDHW